MTTRKSCPKTTLLSCVLFLTAAGCDKPPPPPPAGMTPPAASAVLPAENDAPTVAAAEQPTVPSAAPAAAPPIAPPVQQPPPPPAAPAPPVVTTVRLPAGTRVTVRLDAALGSRTSQAGDQFSATLARPIIAKGREIIASHSAVTGKVIDAKAAGKFGGASSIALRLESVADHQVLTTSYSQSVEGKGKRSGLVIGGTALAGALLGGLAGHGRGALIGGAVGGGVGTLGAAETGNNRDIVILAGTVLTFKLTKVLTVSSSSGP